MTPRYNERSGIETTKPPAAHAALFARRTAGASGVTGRSAMKTVARYAVQKAA
jgi:hypothetical protein